MAASPIPPSIRARFGKGAGRLLAPLLAAALLAGCSGSPGQGGDEGEADSPLEMVRLDQQGEPLSGDVPNGDVPKGPAFTDWACVRDEVTGLVWEVKTAGPGLRGADNRYSWYQPGPHRFALSPGVRDQGDCVDSRCDTSGYAEAVNERGLCGHSDWRLPSRDELASLVRSRQPDGPKTALAFFPQTRPGEYWTATPYRFHHKGVWVWHFGRGFDHVARRGQAKYVRLVRGGGPGTGPGTGPEADR